MTFIINHQNDPRQLPERVFFKGSGALAAYTGVCYQRDHVTTTTGETATDPWGKRDHVVDVPTIGNEMDFAGVTWQSYDAKTGGQWIDIYKPGSSCLIAVNKTVTIGDYVTCIVGGDSVGKFGTAGFLGRGTAKVLETDATAISASNPHNVVLAHLLDGPESGLVENASLAADGGALGASGFTLNGITRITEAVTLAADATYTLANGTFFGQRKGFVLDAALTTNNLVITVTTGIQGFFNATPNTALATITLDDVGDLSVLEWNGHFWVLVDNYTAVLA